MRVYLVIGTLIERFWGVSWRTWCMFLREEQVMGGFEVLRGHIKGVN